MVVSTHRPHLNSGRGLWGSPGVSSVTGQTPAGRGGLGLRKGPLGHLVCNGVTPWALLHKTRSMCNVTSPSVVLGCALRIHNHSTQDAQEKKAGLVCLLRVV